MEGQAKRARRKQLSQRLASGRTAPESYPDPRDPRLVCALGKDLQGRVLASLDGTEQLALALACKELRHDISTCWQEGTGAWGALRPQCDWGPHRLISAARALAAGQSPTVLKKRGDGSCAEVPDWRCSLLVSLPNLPEAAEWISALRHTPFVSNMYIRIATQQPQLFVAACAQLLHLRLLCLAVTGAKGPAQLSIGLSPLSALHRLESLSVTVTDIADVRYQATGVAALAACQSLKSLDLHCGSGYAGEDLSPLVARLERLDCASWCEAGTSALSATLAGAGRMQHLGFIAALPTAPLPPARTLAQLASLTSLTLEGLSSTNSSDRWLRSMLCGLASLKLLCIHASEPTASPSGKVLASMASLERLQVSGRMRAPAARWLRGRVSRLYLNGRAYLLRTLPGARQFSITYVAPLLSGGMEAEGWRQLVASLTDGMVEREVLGCLPYLQLAIEDIIGARLPS